MTKSEPTPFLLTPIDSVMPHNYVPQLLFFPEISGSDVSSVTNTLRGGLSKTLEAMNVLSGTVQTVSQEGMQKGALCVSAPWCAIEDIFQVKDLRHEEGLDYRTLKDRHFPLEDKNKTVLLPVAGIMKAEKSVMLVQLNIIKGGMIMVLCLHHNFTDGNGAPAIARVWAAYCRGEDGLRHFTPDMIDRERLMRGWGDATLDGFAGFTLRPIEEKAPSSWTLTQIFKKALGYLTARLSKLTTSKKRLENDTSPQNESATFFFSKSKLAELKLLVSAREQREDADVWISTNDGLCALLCCCVHSARDEEIRMIADMSWETTSVVGARRVLDPPLPADYIGNIMSFIQLTFTNVSMESTPAKVAEVAHLIRHQIMQRDERYIRNLIAALSSVGDLARVEVPSLPPDNRLSISSWANQNFHDINWGEAVGTKIEGVRVFPLKNLCIIMPELKAPVFAGDDCGLETVIELEKEQMGRLRQNELFMRFAQLRCN